MSTNFTNGSLVARVWRFDGGTELLAKFQYFSDATKWAELLPFSGSYFYVAVCDYSNDIRAFGIKEPAKKDEAK